MEQTTNNWPTYTWQTTSSTTFSTAYYNNLKQYAYDDSNYVTTYTNTYKSDNYTYYSYQVDNKFSSIVGIDESNIVAMCNVDTILNRAYSYIEELYDILNYERILEYILDLIDNAILDMTDEWAILLIDEEEAEEILLEYLQIEVLYSLLDTLRKDSQSE